MREDELRRRYAEGDRDFAFVHLSGAALKGVDLSGANFEGAYLRGADLRGANLECADLQGADLRGSHIKGASLKGANLFAAILSGAILKDADLEEADLDGTYLERADLQGANLVAATLNWKSHELLAEVLRREAGNDPERRAYAALVRESTDWCWSEWEKLAQKPRWRVVSRWAAEVLLRWSPPAFYRARLLKVTDHFQLTPR